jgi:TolB-like protein/class 3 adenylate cyclase
MTEQRRLAAIVSADVAGYSRLMGRDESGTLAALKSLRREVVDPPIASHGGRIVKTTGDGLLLEFPSVVNAVRCAVEVQTAMADRTAGIAEDGRITFRIGINIGDIIVEGEDIFGDGVNVAARLQEIATPGGICISSRVHEDVRDRLDTAFDDGGTQALKNIARPVQVWRWQPGTAASSTPSSAPTALPLPDKPSIAVLPFQNMSGDAEQEYFADGMVEEIITALSQISWFFVIARNSSFTYKGRPVDIRQVGRELGVRYVLEGSVRKSGNRVRINGQLIDASSGNHIWAERFDGLLEDVFDLQDRITSAVAGAIEPKVQEAEIKRAQVKPTSDLTAYDLFLRALAASYEPTREPNIEALALLDQAISTDPRYSSAYGLTCLILTRCIVQSWLSPEEGKARALRAAAMALRTGKDEPYALARAGHTIGSLGQFDEGLAYIERSLMLNPNSAQAWMSGGAVLLLSGQLEKALEYFTRSMRLSPIDPSRYITYMTVAYCHFFMGKNDEAITWADKALALQPVYRLSFLVKIAATVCAGHVRKTQGIVERYRGLDPSVSISSIVRILPAMKKKSQRDYLLAALRKAGFPE